MTSIESNAANGSWRYHISQWQASGLSQAAYCRQHALSAWRFSYWKGKLSVHTLPVADEPKIGFARIQVVASESAPVLAGLSLCFPDGTRMTG